ncbi:MAG: N-acetyl-D-Glu racemase DgcA [Thermaurantiacus sp.]
MTRRVEILRESWAYAQPFRIARATETVLPVIVVRIHGAGGAVGRGEAAGVDYDGETVAGMVDAVETVAPAIAQGATRADLQSMLPPGGARNAVDCALWDLEARETGVRVRDRLGLPPALPIQTAATIGLGDPEATASAVDRLAQWPLLKVKLDALNPIATVEQVRARCPEAAIIVDPNQSWTYAQLVAWAPSLAALGVRLVEQPLARGDDRKLRDYTGPVPLCADESCATASDLAALAGLYSHVNIKLDKCGGLTAALELKQAAHARGLAVMVGCMAGTSLAMAPALLVAEGAAFVDLDGPILHAADRPHGLRYGNGMVHPAAPELWG